MTRIPPRNRALIAIAGFVLAIVAFSGQPADDAAAGGPALQPPFDDDYTLTYIGVVPGNLEFIGPITFMPGDPDTLLYGTLSEGEDGVLNTIPVQRDADDHITGFAAGPTFYADAPFNDGGADYAPNGVLFVTTYGFGAGGNLILQYKPGSTEPDKTTDLATIGIPASVGALRFVPSPFPGAGMLKVSQYSDDGWYTVTYAEDGTGTYNLSNAVLDTQLPDDPGPESPVYIAPGPEFQANSLLLAEYNATAIGAYTIDAEGNPEPASRRAFLTGVNFSPAGMVRDPVTGDLLIADYNNGDLFVVQGFETFPAKGDLNCDGVVNAADALFFLLNRADAVVTPPPGCPAIGGGYPQFQAVGLDNIVGDFNCDTELDEVDLLYLLRHAGGLDNEYPVGCFELGTQL